MADFIRTKPPIILSNLEIRSIFKRDVYLDIIHSKPFVRLKNIHFLGAIDYIITGEKTRIKRQNTRYQHSIGVARLALRYAELKGFSPEDEILLVLSALLHDIGHAPLSHSMESVFLAKYQLGHHEASEYILQGVVTDLVGIRNKLDDHGIEIWDIIQILNGVRDKKFSEAFDYPINIDTIEGIARCIQLIPKYKVSLSPIDIVEELANISENSVKIFDRFWDAKNFVYENLINSKLGVITDFLCQNYMREQKDIRKDFFYHSETKFQIKHAGIFALLNSLSESRAPDLFTRHSINYYERKFEINNNIHVSDFEDLKSRYVQNKVKKHIDW